MVLSSQLSVGMFISTKDGLYKVLSVTKVPGPKGESFIKASLKASNSDVVIERNFKANQEVKEAHFESRILEYLYPEEDSYLFLDLGNYEKVYLSKEIMKGNFLFLKAGITVSAMVYDNIVFSVELPHFLELMVSKTDFPGDALSLSGGTKTALLETGIEVLVPPFVEIGDVIKIDTRTCEYIQRV
ncbi:elongation factor P [Chlamydia pecorum]|uniref:Elongation factor P n=2 Tax=Chlamydia pecorum TaxID=85991 RepID=A0AA34WIE4_CHLPE|nr:elongation factor P [Chlamydia pecorum]AEB41880.1 Elongation factor P [Chlamydia pecorum E58]AGW38049.1 elongation factor P [Chlamydia pecorum PV3056/3]AGW38971.1 elongation factor P [Chlamydia pecorum W73]AGW39897.1 elongation factor P [Chlamydia pecorum P787]ETF37063.1 elongation factor P [Chlamydia pecorum MC/MarsBar]